MDIYPTIYEAGKAYLYNLVNTHLKPFEALMCARLHLTIRECYNFTATYNMNIKNETFNIVYLYHPL